MAPGTVCISIEIELGWGQHDKQDYTLLSEGRRKETETLHRILDSADENEIPITFDVVGHLMLSDCNGSHDSPHERDWFDEDPGTDATRDPQFYAPELLDEIRSANIPHELASHTFSHILCGEVQDEVLDWELGRAITEHERAGDPAPSSIVPPRHSRPRYDLLHEHGIENIRLPKFQPESGRLKQYLRRIQDWLMESGPAAYAPQERDGILETYSTFYPSLTSALLKNGQRDPPLPFRFIPVTLRQRLHQRYLLSGIDSAIDTEGVTHYWTHLQNASNEQQLEPILALFDELGRRQQSGDINVVTMVNLSTG